MFKEGDILVFREPEIWGIQTEIVYVESLGIHPQGLGCKIRTENGGIGAFYEYSFWYARGRHVLTEVLDV